MGKGTTKRNATNNKHNHPVPFPVFYIFISYHFYFYGDFIGRLLGLLPLGCFLGSALGALGLDSASASSSSTTALRAQRELSGPLASVSGRGIKGGFRVSGYFHFL